MHLYSAKIIAILASAMVACSSGTKRSTPAPGKTGSGPIGPGSGDCGKTESTQTSILLGSHRLKRATRETGLGLQGTTTPNTFSKHVQGVIAGSCLECHSKETKSTTPLLDTYDQVKEVAVRAAELMEKKEMPPEGGNNNPNDSEIAAFKKWVSDGLKLGADPERPSAPGDGVAYNNEIRDLLKEACISCHKADESQPPALTSYDLAVAAGSKSVAAVTDGTMPPNAVKNDDWITKFEAWKSSGYLLDTPLADPTAPDDSTIDPAEEDSEDDVTDPCAAD